MLCEGSPSDAQFWANIYSMELTSDECLAKVRSLLSCRSNMNVVRSFGGNEAQMFVDFLDRVLALSCLDDKLQQRSLLLLSKICKAHSIVPASYVLQQDSIRIGRVRYHSGFADVSDGEYLGFPVAVKRLRMNEEESDGIFKRFCREIIGWKHLSHQNILPLLGISMSTSPNCLLILSEWMPNGNVMQYTRSNPEANRLQLLADIMSGVVYLHELNIVHGDLKGANVLVDNAGTACVADFGLMTMADLGTILLSESVVSSGGTLVWMSPELLNLPPGSKDRPTRESDCYALGMVIYEVLTGLRPFYHFHAYKSVFTTAFAILRGERPAKPLDAESLGFTATLWGLVELCWSELGSTRPTARQLFDYFSSPSLTWDPPPVYPAIKADAFNIANSDSSDSLTMTPANSTGGV